MYAVIPFDLGSPVTLDVLYSMEQEKIPVLMELISNQKVRSTVCSENEQALYKWPTFTKASLYKPTWEKLCLILKLNDMNDLVKKIEDYLRKGILWLYSACWFKHCIKLIIKINQA